MNGLFSKATLFLVMYFYLTQPAFSEEITLYAEDGWPPYSYADGTGISNTKVINAFALEGVTVNIEVLPFARIIELLKTGHGLLGINVPKTSEYNKHFIFHDSPLVVAHQHFYYWHDNPLTATTKEDLNKNTRIGGIIGYGYGDFLDSGAHVKLERVKNHQQNLKKLSSHRLDALILFDDVANELIETHKLQDKLIKGPTGESVEIYAAFSKVHPDSKKYIKILNSGLAKLEQQSESR